MSERVRALARWCALAAYVDPPLLRRLRLALEPRLHAADEADLWWSDLVEVRGTHGVVLRVAAAEQLRAELRALAEAGDPRPAEAWRLTSEVHAGVAPAVRLEEEIAWLTVTEADPGPAVEEQLRRVLAGLVAEGRVGLATWTARALPRLPELARRTAAAWYLEQVSRPHLAPGAELGSEMPDDADLATLAALLRDAPPVPLGVLRVGDLLLLGDVGPDGVAIEVPAAQPRLVEVGTADSRRSVAVPVGDTERVAVGWDLVTLHDGVGAVYELGPWDGFDEREWTARTVTYDPDGFFLDDRIFVTSARNVQTGRVLQQRHGISTLRVGGVTVPEPRLRPGRRPLEVGRRWYGWIGSPAQPVVGQVTSGDAWPVTLDLRGPVTEVDELVGSPVIVGGQVAAIVVDSHDGVLRAHPWHVFHPDRSVDDETYRRALTNLVQDLCLEYHTGLRPLSRPDEPADDVLTEAQRQEVKSLAEWIVADTVQAVPVPAHLLSAALSVLRARAGRSTAEAAQAPLPGEIAVAEDVVAAYVAWLDVGAPDDRTAELHARLMDVRHQLHSLPDVVTVGLLFGDGGERLAREVVNLVRVPGLVVETVGPEPTRRWPEEPDLLVAVATTGFLASRWHVGLVGDFTRGPLYPAVRRLVLVSEREDVLDGVLPDPVREKTWVDLTARDAPAEVARVIERVAPRARDYAAIFGQVASALSSRWRDAQAELVELGTPGFTERQPLAEFLDAYLGHVARVLDRAASEQGKVRYETSFAMPESLAAALPLAEFGVETRLTGSNVGNEVTLAAPFWQLVRLFDWAAAELVASLRVATQPAEPAPQEPSQRTMPR